jgi:hypothetical protein
LLEILSNTSATTETSHTHMQRSMPPAPFAPASWA